VTSPAATAASAALLGLPWTAADTPALLVDLDRLERNLAEMAAVARAAGVDLRPHFKTHKSVAIARRQLAAGAVGLTVAKLDEASVLVDAGITDVLIAYELVGETKVARAMDLARRARLTLAVDGIAGARALARGATEAGVRVPVLLEIDSGLRRCGVVPADAAALALAVADLPGLIVEGVFTHAGHAYSAGDRPAVETIAVAEAAAAREAAERIRAAGIAARTVSVGSTPTAARAAGEPGVTEIRPGTYAFYDAVQVALGTTAADRPALSVAATVISRPAPDRAVIDAGSKTFGLDRGAQGVNVVSGFGAPVDFEGSLERLSEEHGILTIPADSPLAVGDVIRLVPNHACTVSNLGREFLGIRDGRIEELIPIDAAGGVH
jgi:D-serine deaminase-like pyridoxal phosphate-dependent protein